MEEALERARFGGYEKDSINIYDHLMSRLFWQALGKAEGWKYPESINSDMKLNGEWMQHWHSFIDWIAEGKDIDSFFNNLLKPSL